MANFTLILVTSPSHSVPGYKAFALASPDAPSRFLDLYGFICKKNSTALLSARSLSKLWKGKGVAGEVRIIARDRQALKRGNRGQREREGKGLRLMGVFSGG